MSVFFLMILSIPQSFLFPANPLPSLRDFNGLSLNFFNEKTGRRFLQISYHKAIAEGGGTNLLVRPGTRFKARYLPTVVMGYDPGPLTDSSVDWKQQRGYPYGPYLRSNTPSKFTKVLKHAKEAASGEEEKFILINAWNDWTHGSYLEPEEMYQSQFLDAVKHVFVDLESLDIEAWIRHRVDVKYDRLDRTRD